MGSIKINVYLLIILFFLFINKVTADDIIDPFPKDITSPITTDAWKILATGTSLTILSLVLKDITIRQSTHEIADEKPLGKYSVYGDILGQILPNILYTSFYAGDYWINGEQRSKELSLMMAKATAYSGLTTDILKKAFNETRPNGGRNSFPSGHTTSAFAFASVVSMNHNIYAGVAATSLATFVGLSRINDKKHYVHDVIAGATIGTAFGVGLYNNYMNQKYIPLVAPINKGLLVGVLFDF